MTALYFSYHKTKTYIAILCLGFVLWQCSSGRGGDVSEYALREDYQDPAHILFHNTDDTTTLYLRFNEKTQVFRRKNTRSRRVANLKIKYLLARDQNFGSIISKEEKNIEFGGEDVKDSTLIIPYAFEHLPDKAQYLEVEVVDRNHPERVYTSTFSIEKSDSSAYNLLLTDSVGRIVFDRFLVEKDVYKFNYRGGETTTVYVQPIGILADNITEKREMIKAAAVDTTEYILPIQKLKTGRSKITFKSHNYYHIYNDEGLSVKMPCFYKYFPKVAQADHMMNSLEIILAGDTTYELMKISEKKKSSAELYWTGINEGKVHKAKKQLIEYYTRVEYANAHFTEKDMGWMSARGQAFVLFGFPTDVVTVRDKEIWRYGFTKTSYPFEIEFVKKEVEGVDVYYWVDTDGEARSFGVNLWKSGVIVDNSLIYKIQNEKEQRDRTRISTSLRRPRF